MAKTGVKKKRTPKKPRNYAATEGTWINVRAANKKIADLTLRIENLERDVRQLVSGEVGPTFVAQPEEL